MLMITFLCRFSLHRHSASPTASLHRPPVASSEMRPLRTE